MRVTIVGVRKSESKGKAAFNYSGLKDFTAYELENSECEGEDVISEFSYTDYGLHSGDYVDFEYEPGFNGRASLVGVHMITPAGNPKDSTSVEAPKDKKETK